MTNKVFRKVPPTIMKTVPFNSTFLTVEYTIDDTPIVNHYGQTLEDTEIEVKTIYWKNKEGELIDVTDLVENLIDISEDLEYKLK